MAQTVLMAFSIKTGTDILDATIKTTLKRQENITPNQVIGFLILLLRKIFTLVIPAVLQQFQGVNIKIQEEGLQNSEIHTITMQLLVTIQYFFCCIKFREIFMLYLMISHISDCISAEVLTFFFGNLGQVDRASTNNLSKQAKNAHISNFN
ncbi:hypothetical protein ACJX0J_010234 [Zea mays]